MVKRLLRKGSRLKNNRSQALWGETLREPGGMIGYKPFQSKVKKLKIFYILYEGNLGIFDFKIFLYMNQVRVKLEEKEKNCATRAEGLNRQNAKGLRQTLRNDRRGGINGTFSQKQ